MAPIDWLCTYIPLLAHSAPCICNVDHSHHFAIRLPMLMLPQLSQSPSPTITAFVDGFQGCYKDGTNGT